MGGFLPYLLFIELITVTFQLLNYYFENGRLAVFSKSVFLILLVLVFLMAAVFGVGWVLSNRNHRYHNRATNALKKFAQNNASLGVFALFVIGSIILGVIFRGWLEGRVFAWLPYQTILICISALLFQILVWLAWIRFSGGHISLLPAVRLMEKYGIFVIFFLFVAVKLYLLLPLVQNYALYTDTLEYSRMAQQINAGGLSIVEFNHYPPLYSFFISFIFSFDRVFIYHYLVVINVLSMTSAVFPIYLISRKYFTGAQSLLVAFAGAAFGAQLFYPSLFMSENIAYPLFFWAVYFCISDPPMRRLELLWNIFAGLSIGMLWLSRYATLTLIPVFLIISWIKLEPEKAGLDLLPSKKKIIRVAAILGVSAALFMIWVIAGLLQGVEIKALLGLYVEGKGPKPVSSTEQILFWWGISLAYFILMSSPVLHRLIGSLKLKKRQQLLEDFRTSPHLFWHISVFLISASMIFVTTRHAWHASYNIDHPHNYIARYIIYLPTLLWISGLLALKEKSVSSVRVVLAALIAISAIAISYFHLASQNWLVTEFLYSGTVDFFTYHSYSVMFVVYLCVYMILDVIFGLLNKPDMRFNAAIIFISLLFLGSWPDYIRNIENNNVMGRQFHEVIAKVLDNPANLYMMRDKENTTIIVPWLETRDSASLHRDEMLVRGIDPTGFHILAEKIRDVKIRGCSSVLLVKYRDVNEYLLVQGDQLCDPPPEQVLSSYTYMGSEYKLVDLTP